MILCYTKSTINFTSVFVPTGPVEKQGFFMFVHKKTDPLKDLFL